MLNKALALVLLAFASMPWADAPPIRILATEPKITGPALALSEAMLDRAGLRHTVEEVPWARAYHIALKDPRVLLFTIARTPERENQFQWIGETFPIDFRAYRLRQRGDIDIRSASDLNRYRLSVVRDSSIVPYLKGLGLRESSSEPGLQFISGIEEHWPKLQAQPGRPVRGHQPERGRDVRFGQPRLLADHPGLDLHQPTHDGLAGVQLFYRSCHAHAGAGCLSLSRQRWQFRSHHGAPERDGGYEVIPYRQPRIALRSIRATGQ